MDRKPRNLFRWLVFSILAAGVAVSPTVAGDPPTFAEAVKSIADVLKAGGDLAAYVDAQAPCLFTRRFVNEAGKETTRKTGPLPGAQILKLKALQERLRIVTEDMGVKGPEVVAEEKTSTVTYEGYSGYWNLKMRLAQTPAGWRIVAFEAYDEAP